MVAVWLFVHQVACSPLVLLEGVSVNVLQVTSKLVLQRVQQQHVVRLSVQQLGGPGHRRQEGHQAGHTAVVKVLAENHGNAGSIDWILFLCYYISVHSPKMQSPLSSSNCTPDVSISLCMDM